MQRFVEMLSAQTGASGDGSCSAILVESLELTASRYSRWQGPGESAPAARAPGRRAAVLGGGAASGRPREPAGEDLPETLLCRPIWRWQKGASLEQVMERKQCPETVPLREN